MPQPSRRYWVETLGCPKNHVDSDKLAGTLLADGYAPAASVKDADLVVVNTCAFIEPARQESVDTVLSVRELVGDDTEIVVTGCMAERYGDELAEALPEADAVRGFGVPVSLGPTRRLATPGDSETTSDPATTSQFDLLELPRPASAAPWAYVKAAEGCDRKCGFCAIPSFRGPQRSRTQAAILAEVEALAAREVVVVAQDLVSYGRDQGQGELGLIPLVQAMAEMVDRVRLLYLYPTGLTDQLIDTIIATGVPYFDLSLQHVSASLLRRMRRTGSMEQVLERVESIRRRSSDAVFRSNFIIGYPGETEADHDQLLRFLEESDLDWYGLFAYSPEPGTYAESLPAVPESLVAERLAEAGELVDRIMGAKRDKMVGRRIEVLVDAPGVGRSWAEAPEIDGIIELPGHCDVGEFVDVDITAARGVDLVGVPVAGNQRATWSSRSNGVVNAQ